MKALWVTLILAFWALVSNPVHAARKTLLSEGSKKGNGKNDSTSGDECDLYHLVAATIAVETACHELRIRCKVEVPSDGGGANTQFRREINPFEGLKPECIRGARTACRTTARGLIQEDTNKECHSLLVNGPSKPVMGCWNLQEAINEFNWAIKEVCLEDAVMLHGGDAAGNPDDR